MANVQMVGREFDTLSARGLVRGARTPGGARQRRAGPGLWSKTGLRLADSTIAHPHRL